MMIFGRILIIIVLIIILLVVFLLIISPGKVKTLTDSNGNTYEKGLNEKINLNIGGVEQGMFIFSRDISNPVILFLHGGPGSPEYCLFDNIIEDQYRLDNHFTVCYWDQRGSGMSYKNVDQNTLTMENMITDTIEVTNFLRERFGQEKIILMGHSWGSYLGLKTIEQAPQLYSSYFGIGQISNQRESEALAYDYMATHAEEIGDTKALEKLKKYDRNSESFPTNDYIKSVRSELMNKYGIGIMHDNFSMTTIAKELIFFKGYTLTEKINFMRGNLGSLDKLFDNVIKDNLFTSSTEFEIPIYVLQGKYDYQVSHDLAKKYLEEISAPKKEFVTFEISAHSPIAEEPEKFLNEVLRLYE